jgi:hypothetical protein|tara:strand:- start:729 stop:1073 length:345 start_codon:yes stop_codon:yes gene_type:complete
MIELVIVNEAEKEVHVWVDALDGPPGAGSWLIGDARSVGGGGKNTMKVSCFAIENVVDEAREVMAEMIAETLMFQPDEMKMMIDVLEVLKDGTVQRKMEEEAPYYFVHAYEGEG